MKQKPLGLLAVGLLTTAANAGQLSLRFAGGGTSVEIGSGETATIEVLFAMNATDSSKARLTRADLRFDVGSLAPGVGDFCPPWVPCQYVLDDPNARFTVTSISTAITNWNTANTTLGPFNRQGFFASAGDPAGTSGLMGNSTEQAPVVIMSFDVTPTGIGDTYIVFRQEDPLPALFNGPNQWGNRFQYTTPLLNQQFRYATGNPGDADPRFAYHGYETLSPIIIRTICFLDSECDDGVFCNGADFCTNGQCAGHSGDPCYSLGLTCDEANDECDCNGDEDCLDDGLFCNGSEFCQGGDCGHTGDPCAVAFVCDETSDACKPDCNFNGVPDDEEVAGGTSLDCNANGTLDECEGVGPPTASGMIGAVSRKNYSGLGPRGISLNITGRIQDQNLTSEPRAGGITELRIFFHIPPGGPGFCPVAIFDQACPGGTQEDYQPYAGLAQAAGAVENTELVLTFSPGLENARTYKFLIGPQVTTVPGQSIEVRSLRGDVNDDGFVNAADRSTVVGVWTGGGFSNRTDLDLSGSTSATDRSIVVGAWTGVENCAP